jgi:hypothetical protein
MFTILHIILGLKAQQRADYLLNLRSILMFDGQAFPNLDFEQLPPSATPPSALLVHLLPASAQHHPFLDDPKESLVYRAMQPTSEDTIATQIQKGFANYTATRLFGKLCFAFFNTIELVQDRNTSNKTSSQCHFCNLDMCS